MVLTGQDGRCCGKPTDGGRWLKSRCRGSCCTGKGSISTRLDALLLLFRFGRKLALQGSDQIVHQLLGLVGGFLRFVLEMDFEVLPLVGIG